MKTVSIPIKGPGCKFELFADSGQQYSFIVEEIRQDVKQVSLRLSFKRHASEQPEVEAQILVRQNTQTLLPIAEQKVFASAAPAWVGGRRLALCSDEDLIEQAEPEPPCDDGNIFGEPDYPNEPI